MDKRAQMRAPRYTTVIGRDRQHPEQLVGRMLKGWWGGPGVGVLQRQIAEHWIDISGMGEAEALSSMLIDLGLSVRGGLYDL